jgi:hypothetical protein
MNRHMTFVFKQCTKHQCSNSTSRWMTFVSISYEPMKSKFHMTIITKSWPMKFVMINLRHPLWMTINFNTYFNQTLTHGKTWNFLIYDFISYIMTKVNMVQFHLFTWWHLDKWKFDTWNLGKIYLKSWFQPFIMIIQFKCIYIVTCGTIKSCHIA